MYVVPRIDVNRAVTLLSERPRPLSRRRKIIKTDLLYLCCYLFAVKIKSKNEKIATGNICVDGLYGTFAFFQETSTIDKPNMEFKQVDFELTEQEAKENGLKEYKRYILRQSLRRRESTTVVGISEGRKIYYPFWIGYFRRQGRIDFEVIDGLSGQKQGVKMRPVFIRALLQIKNRKG